MRSKLVPVIITLAFIAGLAIYNAVPARAAVLKPFCTQHQLKVKAYERGECRIWFRNAVGGGQVYGRHGR